MTVVTLNRSAALCVVVVIALAACGNGDSNKGRVANTENAAQSTGPAPLPEPVNGWIEHPLAKGTIKVQSTPWRTDVVEIPLPPDGGELEYALNMKSGDAIVYSIDFGKIENPDVFVTEFHGHTEKRADGVGDLMFYSKAKGSPENGQLVAPWDGVHGWYLKNDSAKEAVVTLKIAGFYELVDQ
jgi:hypothetical protein